MDFKSFIEAMDGRHRRSATVRIADACLVSHATATRWVKAGKVRHRRHQEAINREFNLRLFEL